MKYFVACIAAVAITCFPSVLNAQLINYSFSGLLPTGSTTHSEVSDGETFIASLLVDQSAPDLSAADPTLGFFAGAVVSGSLTFSGGFQTTEGIAGGSVVVLNDFGAAANGAATDGISVSTTNFSVLATTEDITTLASDSLVDVGVSFNSFVPNLTDASTQLDFTDADGVIFFDTSQATNVSFTSTAAVPEPGSLALLSLGLTLICCRRNR